MKELITEGLSKYVYHFTDLNSLNSIIETNTIYLSPADSKADKSCQPKDYNFFLSLTTQSSFEIGYAGKKNNIKSNASESDEYKRVNANTQRGFSQLGINPLYRELPNDTEEPPTDYTFKVKSDDGKSYLDCPKVTTDMARQGEQRHFFEGRNLHPGQVLLVRRFR